MAKSRKQKSESEESMLGDLEVGQKFKVISWKDVNPGDLEKNIILRLLSKQVIRCCLSSYVERLQSNKPFVIASGVLVGGGKKISNNEYERMYVLPHKTIVNVLS